MTFLHGAGDSRSAQRPESIWGGTQGRLPFKVTASRQECASPAQWDSALSECTLFLTLWVGRRPADGNDCCARRPSMFQSLSHTLLTFLPTYGSTAVTQISTRLNGIISGLFKQGGSKRRQLPFHLLVSALVLKLLFESWIVSLW